MWQKGGLFAAEPEAYGGKIPFIVTDLIEELTRRDAGRVIGIFRLNGSDTQTRELIAALDQGRVHDWSKFDVHSIATALKRYFRQIGEMHPLIPFEIYDCIIAIAQLPCDEEMKVLKIKSLCREMMTPASYRTLAYFCQFLHELAQFATDSQMNSRNLSICIGPNIIVSPTPDNIESLNESLSANTALEIMIRQYPVVFDDFATKGLRPEDLCTDDDIEQLLR
jgi:hypothetical protein